MHTANVNEGQKTDQRSEDQSAGYGISRMRPELAKINDKQVGVGGRRGHLSQPQHPGGLDTHETSKGDASVEIWAACFLKARCNFRKATHDHARSRTRREHGVWAVFADDVGHGGRQPEDAAADNGVDDQRHQAPAANRAHQIVVRCS